MASVSVCLSVCHKTHTQTHRQSRHVKWLETSTKTADSCWACTEPEVKGQGHMVVKHAASEGMHVDVFSSPLRVWQTLQQ